MKDITTELPESFLFFDRRLGAVYLASKREYSEYIISKEDSNEEWPDSWRVSDILYEIASGRFTNIREFSTKNNDLKTMDILEEIKKFTKDFNTSIFISDGIYEIYSNLWNDGEAFTCKTDEELKDAMEAFKTLYTMYYKLHETE